MPRTNISVFESFGGGDSKKKPGPRKQTSEPKVSTAGASDPHSISPKSSSTSSTKSETRKRGTTINANPIYKD